ncbi:hypothetical protein [Cellulomonas massiliensis]|uniref:hypothetical protein n=1 Tax=Cellulomonas massiliensis TaxID=1465811 RepID=UPI00030DB4A4|nr:hypothetical protein [Cellulomonas massiliensis]
MGSAELFEKARQLDALADDVEVVVDTAAKVAASPDWECDNATDVRGALGGWKGKARSAAANLRAEASRVRGDARRAEQREEAAREERERERERARSGGRGPTAW